ncbi:hypothetical protein UFOVP603_49 [uncultured Caudovirales phage]|uniref:Uncharacterized protein n=1 Tax=uncultured Caudovirales phage TaxID=2100421 RepID=A0A6J5N7P5_9CAUD|nr:hypothetical protein UFOVP603_49 [uncultured Caudovirales phage]
MTAVEFLENKLNDRLNHLVDHRIHIKEFVRTAKCAEIRKILEVIHIAEEMELKEKAKKQLFIGKVSEIIGAEKTIELLKEVNNEIK